jgi:glutamate/tyrosine decarboxylase-like PLP-dependent enzyme
MPSDPDRFDWHPEPTLIGFADEARARPALETLGSAIWDEALAYLYGYAVRRPVGTDSYPELRRTFFGEDGRPGSPPAEPSTSTAVLAEFRDRVAPYLFNSQHPGAFSYFTPPPLPISIAGELLSQWAQQGTDVWHAGPIAALVEEEVIAWLRDLVGFDGEGFGVLTSGGVMANLIGMTVARDRHLRRLLGHDDPPRGARLERTRVYASDQTHFSIARALDVLGFPSDTLRVIASDERYRLRAEPVAEAIAEDRAAGLRPFAISGVAGSTNTGSVDRLAELADLAEREDLWLHVDAAYGGAARFSERLAGRIPALERADSVTVDPHKWFFQAYDIGGLVVRSREDLHETFHRSPEYYRSSLPETQPLNWYEYSIEGTRRFRALKLWLSWKFLGTEGFARLVEDNVALAVYLVKRCRELRGFEVEPEDPELSVICFRHVPPGLEGDALDAHQDRLQRALEVSGEGWVSTTKLRGRTYLRAGIVNYLSTEDDVDRVLDALVRISTATLEGSA